MMKWSFIPSLCTVLNLAAGTVSLLLTIHEHYPLAALMILFAALFDVFDGLLARLLHCTSEFGKQLDSLADLISFGAAPVFLVLFDQLDPRSGSGSVAAVLFVICGALRLARFNVTGTSAGFTGMPITAAGTVLALLSLITHSLQPTLLIALIALLSFLMISRIPFPSFKNKMVRK
ncbi:CDP-diacylglycerol--serine O-phosphatidyltransferase [Paenibacillus hunanensis]|nr:CDP-diacylglycerol--serine O-phosphatidyltransferase [Paenibacillus hunanensis]WPP43227.1 CDP-diacylglycerol--serine O-phosphatidyltransferase [Paenibacillus hunanensis]